MRAAEIAAPKSATGAKGFLQDAAESGLHRHDSCGQLLWPPPRLAEGRIGEARKATGRLAASTHNSMRTAAAKVTPDQEEELQVPGISRENGFKVHSDEGQVMGCGRWRPSTLFLLTQRENLD